MKIKKRNFKPLIVVLAAIVMSFFIISSYQPQSKEFVSNMTFVKYSDLFFNYEVTKYPSNAEVSILQPTQEKMNIGVAVDPWSLNFGIIPEGKNFGSKSVDIGNLENKDSKVIFKIYGNITPFVNFTKNNFILHSNESTTIEIQFHTDLAAVGNYSGEIDVIIQKPKYNFIYSLWR